MLPFDAGSSWSLAKTKLFNLLFSQLTISFDWKNPSDIEFVRDLKNLKGLTIESTKSFDLTPIGDCKNLQFLNIASRVSRSTELDLSVLPIKTFLGSDDDKLQSIYKNKTLNRMTISNYLHTDLQQVEAVSVEHISIDGSKSLQSLKGIEKLENLKLIEIENCPNLRRPLLYVNEYPLLRIYINGKLQK